MTAVDCSLTIYANCPHCDSNDTRTAWATSIVQHRNLLFASGMQESEFPNDLEFKSGEALLKGWCLSCLKTFSIFLTSSTFNEEGLEEIGEQFGVIVDFSITGTPTVLRLGTNAYPVSQVHSHKPMSSFLKWDSDERNVGESLFPYDPTLESLYGRAPFGSWDIELNVSSSEEKANNADNVLEFVQNIERRALTAGYVLSQHSPAEFLSIGEVRTLIVSKWDTTFSNHFAQQQKLLGDLATFEEYRNNVAHGRSLSVRDYTNCVRAAKDLRRRFGL